MKYIGLLFNLINEFKNLKWNFLNNNFSKYLYENFIDYYRARIRINSIYKNTKITTSNLRMKKSSDTLFVFGTGSSLKKISKKNWDRIKKFDSIGINYTILLKKIHFTYQINRELHTSNKKEIRKQVKIIKNNKFLRNTVFLFPSGFTCSYTNWIFSLGNWNRRNLFYLFNTNIIYKLPLGSLETGLIHRMGTITDAISFGYFMGYKKIILAGVDLYDRKYFYTSGNKTSITFGQNVEFDNRGKTVMDKHQTADNGIIPLMENWRSYLNKKKVQLLVYNKKSLLTKVLKIYDPK